MIGAGLFNNIAPTAKISSYGAILGLLLASTLAIANASSSAQLSSLFPKTGGTYLYANEVLGKPYACLLYTSPSPRDLYRSRMPSSA